MMSTITYNCEQCGKEHSQPFAWYKKREHHFCSRVCANRYKADKVSLGLSRKEYEKQYWEIPENKARRKIMSRDASIRRQKKMGDSLKKTMLNRVKGRAEKQGVPFDLTINDFDVPLVCPVLGISLSVKIGGRGGSPESPSLDRVIPSLGYVRGNVNVISNKANHIKRDATYEEILAVAAYIKSNLRFENT